MVQLLNYAATHPKSITCYHTSGIILDMYIMMYFLSAPVAKIRSGVYHYLNAPSANPKPPPSHTHTHTHITPPINGPIHVEFTTTKNLLVSIIEAELEAFFFNCQRRSALIIYLDYMGHQQPPTPVVTDSTAGDLFVNNNIQKCRSREINMIFY